MPNVATACRETCPINEDEISNDPYVKKPLIVKAVIT